MGFSIAFIKDALRDINQKVAEQGKLIEETLQTNREWKELLLEIKTSLNAQGTTLPDHMAKMRAAKAAKKEANE